MSTSPRIDLLGLDELDSRFAPESVFPDHIDLPETRSARIESRRAFVEMKQLFMRAVENLEHRKGAWLRAQVRAAEDPIDLWLLRGPLLATLREDDVATRTMRAALYRTLDRTFPEAFGSAEVSAQISQRPDAPVASSAQAASGRPFHVRRAAGTRVHRGHNRRVNIIILDDYQDAVRKLPCASKLSELNAKVFTNTVKGIGQLSVRLRDAEVLVLIRERTRFPRQLLEKLPKLRLIAQTGKVGEHIDIEACTAHGIAVAEGVGSPWAPAELTWALIMASMRRLPQYISNLKHGAWQQSGLKAASMPPNFGLGVTLRGKTLGIWGYGRIGKLVAGYGKAFGMEVTVWGSEESRGRAVADGHRAVASREELFASADVLSVHLRLTDATRHLIKLNDLLQMKPTALFVNTSRAELLEESALVAALNRGRPGMAAVDVFESEPILAGHPLLRLENAVCTPHIGYVEQSSYETYFGAAFDNVVNFINGTPTNIVNPDALKVLR